MEQVNYSIVESWAKSWARKNPTLEFNELRSVAYLAACEASRRPNVDHARLGGLLRKVVRDALIQWTFRQRFGVSYRKELRSAKAPVKVAYEESPPDDEKHGQRAPTWVATDGNQANIADLRGILGRLSESHKDFVIAHYIAGYSIDDAVESSGIKRSHVQTIMATMRKAAGVPA